MIENIILWLIIGAAAVYCGRTAYRTLSGRSKGCGCSCDPTEPTPQQVIPDISENKDQESEGK